MVIFNAIEAFEAFDEKLNMRNLIFGRKSLAGSLIGGTKKNTSNIKFLEFSCIGWINIQK
tara:strand:+ start:448 stop:627 length:180 start_codon:yes stop_codon:yes gene_type:complete